MILAAVLAAALSLAPPSGPAISFGDASHGWIGGQRGVLATADGGRTWRAELQGRAVQVVDAVDRSTAFALGGGSLLERSPGAGWHVVSTPHLDAIDFVDARDGLGLNRSGAVLATRDGGRVWTTLPAPTPMEAICFSGASRGWAARRGSVWSTRDGGRTWTRSLLVPAQQGLPLPVLGCRGGDVWVELHEGAAAGSEGYVVFRSLDGGLHWRAVLANLDPRWRRLPRISNDAGPFAVLGAGAAVLTGLCGPCGRVQPTLAVLETRDGGRSFVRAAPRDGYAPLALAFGSADVGCLITTAPRSQLQLVWRTTDGGRTWRPVLGPRAL